MLSWAKHMDMGGQFVLRISSVFTDLKLKKLCLCFVSRKLNGPLKREGACENQFLSEFYQFYALNIHNMLQTSATHPSSPLLLSRPILSRFGKHQNSCLQSFDWVFLQASAPLFSRMVHGSANQNVVKHNDHFY